MKFAGVAVYVYGITPNSMSAGRTDVTTFMNLSFVLDDEHVGNYVHQPNESSVVEYNVPVYVNTSLSNGGHSLLIQFGGSSPSLFLFDYVVYTAVEAISSASIALPTLSSPESLPGTSSATSLQGTAASPHASSSTVPPTSPRNHHTAELAGGIAGGTLAVTSIAILLYAFQRRRLRHPSSLPLSTWNWQFLVRRGESSIHHAEVSERPPDHSFPGAWDDSAGLPHETLSYHGGTP